MFKIKLLDDAKIDYNSIWDFIANDNLFYANEVLNKINKSIFLLKDFPYIWRDLDGKYRQIVEPKYKFKIVYKVGKNIIYIVSIFREQDRWW